MPRSSFHRSSTRSSRSFSWVCLSGLCITSVIATLLSGCSGGGSGTNPTASAPPNHIVAWGDSLTAGYEGNINPGSYPTYLQSLVGPTVVNQGLGGQRSNEIGIRQGAIHTSIASVSGGAIPACTSLPCSGVTITFPAGRNAPVIGQGSPPVKYNFVAGTVQTIPPIHGVVTVTYDGRVYTFTPDGLTVGATLSGTSAFVIDTPYANYLPIFWEGRNDILISGQTAVMANIAAQVATVPAGTPYLVLGVTNQNKTSEFSGAADYNTITALNSTLAATYPQNYLDIRASLVASYNPWVPTDVADHANDEPPTSLRAVIGTATLTTGITAADCSSVNIPFSLVGGEVESGLPIIIDGEEILATTVAGNAITVCTRGYAGTTAASHSPRALLTEYDAQHFSAAGYAVVAKAVAAKLQSMGALAVSIR